MLKKRLLFEKRGRAIYISHLDLLRTFQRVFKRAGINLRHSEGFNPHPYLSFALPLSVGTESVCELLDFELTEEMDEMLLPAMLNRTMPEGIKALTVYESARKFAFIKWLAVEGAFVYDKGVGNDTVTALTELFNAAHLSITKKSKKGLTELDAIPCIHSISFEKTDNNKLTVRAVVSAQDPSLNPEHLVTAIKTHLPAFTPDFASFKRLEIYNADHTVFR